MWSLEEVARGEVEEEEGVERQRDGRIVDQRVTEGRRGGVSEVDELRREGIAFRTKAGTRQGRHMS